MNLGFATLDKFYAQFYNEHNPELFSDSFPLTGLAYQKDDILFYIQQESKIVSVLGLRPVEDNTYWFMFLSTHPEQQNKGYSKALLHYSFKHLNNNSTIAISSYTPDGEAFLKNSLEQVAEQYNLKICNHKDKEWENHKKKSMLY